MGIISDIFNGFIILSFLALTQHGCSVKKMAEHAAEAHERGLTSYGAYSRTLTGSRSSWVGGE